MPERKEVVAVAVESVAASPTEDEPAEQDETPSLTDLLAELARNVSVMVFCETQLVAVRNMPQVRRTARDISVEA